MTKLFDGSGNAVEAFTQEEVDKLVAENPKVKETSDALTQAQKDLVDANKKIEEFNGTNKGQNMAALREAKEAAEKAVDEKTKGFLEGLAGIKKELDESKLDKTFLSIAEGDDEMAGKIKTEYNRIIKPGDTDEELRKKLGDAYRLASGFNASPSAFNRVLGSAGAPNAGASGNEKYSPQFVQFAGRFGITAEDIKKFGPK